MEVEEEPEEVETNETVECDKNEKPNRISKLPLTRIKHIIKTDPDVTLASQDSVVLIAKATEMFLHHFTRSAYVQTAKGKRKTMQKKDIDISVDLTDEYAFLEGMLD
ncbi:DNA polymerase epsilon subunit 4-like [Antedon mediterranea]|uniref:DNA polymerase epsilon subunit 4-like n=1 Tax=Antedon mediterranea TaxID=105859 RepID=UPI003AF69909